MISFFQDSIQFQDLSVQIQIYFCFCDVILLFTILQACNRISFSCLPQVTFFSVIIKAFFISSLLFSVLTPCVPNCDIRYVYSFLFSFQFHLHFVIGFFPSSFSSSFLSSYILACVLGQLLLYVSLFCLFFLFNSQ